MIALILETVQLSNKKTETVRECIQSSGIEQQLVSRQGNMPVRRPEAATADEAQALPRRGGPQCWPHLLPHGGHRRWCRRRTNWCAGRRQDGGGIFVNNGGAARASSS
jgi:hypothetical protein